MAMEPATNPSLQPSQQSWIFEKKSIEFGDLINCSPNNVIMLDFPDQYLSAR